MLRTSHVYAAIAADITPFADYGVFRQLFACRDTPASSRR